MINKVGQGQLCGKVLRETSTAGSVLADSGGFSSEDFSIIVIWRIIYDVICAYNKS